MKIGQLREIKTRPIGAWDWKVQGAVRWAIGLVPDGDGGEDAALLLKAAHKQINEGGVYVITLNAAHLYVDSDGYLTRDCFKLCARIASLID